MPTSLNKSWLILFFLVALVVVAHCQNKVYFRKGNGLRLKDSVIRIAHAQNEFECGVICSKEPSCVSANFKKSGEDRGKCELNSKILHESQQGCLKHPEYSYLELLKQQCQRNATEPVKQHVTSAENSCKALLEKNSSLPNGVYKIQNTSMKTYPVYCHMTDIPGCGAGAWTLVMKLDGNKDTFRYSSSYWSENRTYGVQEGLEGLTDKETKLDSYWNTPFTKICLGMKVNGVTKWMKLDYEASSLYSVIADGTFRPTTAGRSAWKSLIDGSSLQLNCNKEGLNIHDYVNGNLRYPVFLRFGIVANDANSCLNCNSWIGFGVTFADGPHSCSITTGNRARYGPDNGEKHTAVIGYVLVS